MRCAQTRCEQLLAYWRSVYGIPDRWQIAIVLVESRQEAEEDDENDLPQRPAYTRVDHGYSKATITVNAYLIDDDEELICVMGHEVGHCVTHRPARFIATALGPGNSDTAEEMGEELTELLVKSVLFAVRNPPPAQPATPDPATPAPADLPATASRRRRTPT